MTCGPNSAHIGYAPLPRIFSAGKCRRSGEPGDLEDNYSFAPNVSEVRDHEPASGFGPQARPRTVIIPSVRIDH
jgi:hypothetical protein